MTTIAVSRSLRQMAADSQTNIGDTIAPNRRVKIRRYPVEGFEALVGSSGNVDDIELFHEWLASGRDREERPPLSECFAAAVLTGDGRLYTYYDSCVPVPTEGDLDALGTGFGYALAAMYAGATPEEAVEVACRLDTHSGPPVIVEKL